MKLLLQRLNFLFVATAILLVAACSEQKKLQKAQQRVLTDDNAFNYIGGKWAKLNPCIIDSVIKYSSNEIVKTDTFYKHGDFVYAPATHDTIIVHRNVDHYDTARVYIRDKRYEGILKDSLEFYQLADSRSQTAAEIAKQYSAKKTKIIIFWIALVALENIAIIVYKTRGL
jgi:hypothetical protein